MPLPRKAWQALKDVQKALETAEPIETDDWVALVLAIASITEYGAEPNTVFGYEAFRNKPMDLRLHHKQWRIACAVLKEIESGNCDSVAAAKRKAKTRLGSKTTDREIHRAWKVYGGTVKRIAKKGRNPARRFIRVRDKDLVFERKVARLFLT